MQFHERLKSLRLEKGFTQKKLADHLNYGSSAIANYESRRNQPSIPDLIKIAQCFDVSMDYLFGISNIRNPYTDDQNTPYFDQLRQSCAKLSPESVEILLTFAEFLTTYDKSGKPVSYVRQTRKEGLALQAAETQAAYTPSKKYATTNEEFACEELTKEDIVKAGLLKDESYNDESLNEEMPKE